MTRHSVVEIRNVSRSFRSPEGASIRAVDDISLNIEAGKFTTLLGPSGCGKTTLLRMIGGFEEPDQGTVFIDGADMTYRPPYERPVNTVFQHYALFPHMTVAENIGYRYFTSSIRCHSCTAETPAGAALPSSVDAHRARIYFDSAILISSRVTATSDSSSEAETCLSSGGPSKGVLRSRMPNALIFSEVRTGVPAAKRFCCLPTSRESSPRCKRR